MKSKNHRKMRKSKPKIKHFTPPLCTYVCVYVHFCLSENFCPTLCRGCVYWKCIVNYNIFRKLFENTGPINTSPFPHHRLTDPATLSDSVTVKPVHRFSWNLAHQPFLLIGDLSEKLRLNLEDIYWPNFVIQLFKGYDRLIGPYPPRFRQGLGWKHHTCVAHPLPPWNGRSYTSNERRRTSTSEECGKLPDHITQLKLRHCLESYFALGTRVSPRAVSKHLTYRQNVNIIFAGYVSPKILFFRIFSARGVLFTFFRGGINIV